VARGAAEPGALAEVVNVLLRIRDAFPCYQERLAFSSDASRALWRARGTDRAWLDAHPEINARIYSVGNVITALASVQETGPRLTMVQGLHFCDGPGYYDLHCLVDSLRQIKTFDRLNAPFPWIGLGQPALGLGDGQRDSLYRTAAAMKPVFEEARALRAGVLLASDPLGGINAPAYRNLEDSLRSMYPAFPLGVALHESRQAGREALASFADELPPPAKVLIASLAPVSSDEVRRDISGEGAESWSSVCRAMGYEPVARTRGLAAEPGFAELLVEGLKRQEEALSRRYIE
jgi:cobalamin biosynthesis Co2+ chelatase CbiK